MGICAGDRGEFSAVILAEVVGNWYDGVLFKDVQYVLGCLSRRYFSIGDNVLCVLCLYIYYVSLFLDFQGTFLVSKVFVNLRKKSNRFISTKPLNPQALNILSTISPVNVHKVRRVSLPSSIESMFDWKIINTPLQPLSRKGGREEEAGKGTKRRGSDLALGGERTDATSWQTLFVPRSNAPFTHRRWLLWLLAIETLYTSVIYDVTFITPSYTVIVISSGYSEMILACETK